MRKYRIYIALAAIVLSAFVAYGLFTSPKPQSSDSECFSAVRVAADLEVISKEHHSIEHPKNREVVCNYLFERLSGMGGEPKLYAYDSIGVFNDKKIDIENIYSQFEPTITYPEGVSSYVLLIAHYDSRFGVKRLEDTVYSYGAADDGYGCGVILESVSQALKYKKEWRQGIKVLFTDCEEWQMFGIKNAIEKNPELFENVGLVLNIDARGMKGPALLFETGTNNTKVMNLYADVAKHPYTYTFTSVVYKTMPNFTDYTLLKDSLPGLNFSVIDDRYHYHNDLDNYSNISLYAIQHYGAQIEPIMKEYLTGIEYRDVDYLKAEKDNISFTIPLLGIFNFSKGGYALLNAITLALFCLAFCFSILSGRIHSGRVFKTMGRIFLFTLIIFALGYLLSWISSKLLGRYFILFGDVKGGEFYNTAMIVIVALLAVISLWCYLLKRRKAANLVSSTAIRKSAAASGVTKYSLEIFYGTMLVLLVLSAVSYFAIGENFFFIIPLLIGSVSLILWRLFKLRSVLLIAVIVILLHAFSFCYVIGIALTIEGLYAVLLLAFLYIMTVIPLIDLYSRKEKTI
ncbi:MAG: M28 family peptidase [Bacteroidales bacterium]